MKQVKPPSALAAVLLGDGPINQEYKGSLAVLRGTAQSHQSANCGLGLVRLSELVQNSLNLDSKGTFD